jgi:DNA polymerase III delta subunit
VAVSRGKAPTFLEVRDAALERLARAPLPPLVVLAGEEPFVKERLVEAAATAAGGRAEAFAPRPGESDADSSERLLQTWCTPTLFDAGRLLVARDGDKLLAGPRLARFEEVLDGGRPPQSLLVTLESLDGRTRLAKRLREEEALVSLPPLRDAPPPWHTGGPFLETELNLWIRDEARRLGLRCDLPVADELYRRVGNEPSALVRKLEQLLVLVGPARPLTTDDVRRHVRRSSSRLLAQYEESLRAGDAGAALDLLDRMLAEGVQDHTGRLVDGDQAADTVLRGLLGGLARVVAAHEQLGPELRDALLRKPWQRSAEETAALAAVLGAGGRRVFLERDLRSVPPAAALAAFRLALQGLRALRDGRGASLHALTVRLARAHAPPRRVPERRAAS